MYFCPQVRFSLFCCPCWLTELAGCLRQQRAALPRVMDSGSGSLGTPRQTVKVSADLCYCSINLCPSISLLGASILLRDPHATGYHRKSLHPSSKIQVSPQIHATINRIFIELNLNPFCLWRFIDQSDIGISVLIQLGLYCSFSWTWCSAVHGCHRWYHCRLDDCVGLVKAIPCQICALPVSDQVRYNHLP